MVPCDFRGSFSQRKNSINESHGLCPGKSFPCLDKPVDTRNADAFVRTSARSTLRSRRNRSRLFALRAQLGARAPTLPVLLLRRSSNCGRFRPTQNTTNPTTAFSQAASRPRLTRQQPCSCRSRQARWVSICSEWERSCRDPPLISIEISARESDGTMLAQSVHRQGRG